MFLGRAACLLERLAFLCWGKTRYLYFLRNSSVTTCYVIISDHWTKWHYNHHRKRGREKAHLCKPPAEITAAKLSKTGRPGTCQFSRPDTSFRLIITSQDICSFFCFSGTCKWNPWVSSFTLECLSVWQKPAKVWEGSKGEGDTRTTAWFVRQNLRLNAGLVFRVHAGCIICHILYSGYRVCIQAQTLCINIYTRLYTYIYTYIRRGDPMLFSPWFSVKNWKVKQSQNVSFVFHKHTLTAVLLQN